MVIEGLYSPAITGLTPLALLINGVVTHLLGGMGQQIWFHSLVLTEVPILYLA